MSFFASLRPLHLAFGVVVLYCGILLAITGQLSVQGRELIDFTTGAGGDAREYVLLGQSIAEHHTFSVDGRYHEFFRTPGYPVVVALMLSIFHSVTAVIFLQIAFVAGSVLLIVAIGERLFSRTVGLVAALLYALDPTTILTALSTLSDIPFVFVLLSIVFLITRGRKNVYLEGATIGLLVGYLALVRPLGLYVLPILFAWFAYTLVSPHLSRASFRLPPGVGARALGALGLLLAGALLLIAPWMMRNQALGGHLSLSSIGPYNFLFYNLVEYRVAQGEGTRESIHNTIHQQLGTSDGWELRDFSYTDRIQSLVDQELDGNVVSYGVFHTLKTIPFYIGSSIQASLRILQVKGVLDGGDPPVPNISALVLKGNIVEAARHLVANPFGLLERFFWLFVLAVDVLALVFLKGRARVALVFCASLALAFGMLTGPVSFPRYRLPAEPFLFLGMAAGCAYFFDWVHRLRARHSNRFVEGTEFLKYVFASLVALAVDVGLLVFLTSVVHLHYLVAGLVAFLAGALVVYLLSIHWIFSHRRLGAHRGKEFLIFLLIGAIGLLLNESILWFLTGVVGTHYLVSKGCSVLLVFGWNFIARKRMLF